MLALMLRINQWNRRIFSVPQDHHQITTTALLSSRDNRNFVINCKRNSETHREVDVDIDTEDDEE